MRPDVTPPAQPDGSAQPVPEPHTLRLILAAALGFIALYSITVVGTAADTLVYVSNLLAYRQQGPGASPRLLWEFGHLVWRPIGYVLWLAAHPFLSSWSGDNPVLEMTAVLIAVNFVVGLLLTWVLFLVCRRLGLTGPAALIVTAGFLLSSTVLNYVHSGMSYNPGLLAQLTALLLLLEAMRRPGRAVALGLLAGCALALSVALWFPYVLTVPSVLLAGWLIHPAEPGPDRPSGRGSLRLVIAATLATAVVGVAFFGVGAALGHISSYPAFRDWVVNSAHGINPDRRLMRLPTGVTRSFFYMGDDGFILKRFIFGDPYAPASAFDILRAGIWKMVVVFLGIAGLVVALARRREGWPALAVLLCGALPALGFAVVLFETAEPARYEPAYPGLLVAICAALLLPKNVRAPRWLLAGVFAVMALVNLKAYAWDLRAGASEDLARAVLVQEHTAHHGVAFITGFRDHLSSYVQKHPFSPMNRQNALPLFHLVEPGNVRLPVWRQDAACRMLETWDAGGEVWVSDRLVAPRPKPTWDWAEHDDSRIHWTDLPAFFTPLETDSHIGGADGFFRVTNAARNRAALQAVCSR